jgi:hypothetical protein
MYSEEGSVEVERIIRMRNKREGGRADRYLLTWTARPVAFRRIHLVVSYPFYKAPWEALSRRGWVEIENREDTCERANFFFGEKTENNMTGTDLG